MSTELEGNDGGSDDLYWGGEIIVPLNEGSVVEDEDGAPVWYVYLRGKENTLVSIIEFPPGAFLEGHFNMHVGI